MNPFASLGVATPRVVCPASVRLPLVALASGLLAVSAPPSAEAVAAAEPAPAVDFQRDIRPILSDNCFACHGPDEATREADLRLDTRDGAFSPRPPAGRSSRPRDPAVVPGDASASLLVERINHTDALRRMPPEVSQKSLSDEQIDLLTRWIEQGAPWDQHWSFAAIDQPATPTVEDEAWVHDPLDRFVLARLEDAGLSPAEEADRRIPRPARGPRPDRPAARSGHPRDLPRRHGRRRLRATRGPAPLLGPLGRAPLPLLARRRPLRGHPRHPQRQLPGDVRLPGLGHQGVQPEPAVRRVHGRTDRRRPAGRPDPRPVDRHRPPAQQHHDQRRRRAGRGVRGDLRQGPRRDDRQRVPGADRRLRDLPRPQVRSHRPARVLRADRVLQEHHPVRDGRQHLGPAADPGGAARRGPRHLVPAARRGRRARGRDDGAPQLGRTDVCRMDCERRPSRDRSTSRSCFRDPEARSRGGGAGGSHQWRTPADQPARSSSDRTRTERSAGAALRGRVLGRTPAARTRHRHAVLPGDVDLHARGRGAATPSPARSTPTTPTAAGRSPSARAN